MGKKFNVTGLCLPDQHYMADTSKKLEQTLRLIDDGAYFIINRPRQYGKTTTLYRLADILIKTGDYIVFNISFEGVGDLMFAEEKAFSKGFIELLAEFITESAPEFKDWIDKEAAKTQSLKEVSNVITTLADKTHKKLILLIDEVDKSSNNQIFVSFLALLRNKYLQRSRIKTFHSVVLAGLHDVKSLKLKLRSDEEAKSNSPWDIAVNFEVNMNLQVSEIQPMLDEYCTDKKVKLDTALMSELLFYYTSGYPFLVSKLCKIMDEDILPEKTEREWTLEDLETAVQELVKENNTNFETLSKSIENNKDVYSLVYQVAVEVEPVFYSPIDPTTNFALLYGIVVNKNGVLKIHNRIYQEILVNYMTLKMHRNQVTAGVDFGSGYKNPDKSINMETVLLKFQAFMREQYSRKDRTFLERHGRLVFLAFIKPIINGSGYDFKEPQTSDEKRLDVIITYLQYRYLAELKIWRGEAAHQEGLAQLSDYLDRLALTEGYLVIFDHATIKSWKSEWLTVEDKKIFAIWV